MGINMSDLNSDNKLIDALERQAQPLKGLDNDYDSIIQTVQGNTSVNDKAKIVVLIGEATYGTAEFYRTRSEITQRLITEQGFDAIAIEADWPDASRINRYVSGESNDIGADAALSDFERFPAWIWRNIEVQAFIQWLHHYNQMHRKDRGPRTQTKNVGFYGLDFYNMTASIGELLSYLDKTNPKEAEAARARYASFSEFISEPQACYSTIGSHGPNSSEQKAITQLEQEVINQLIARWKMCLDSERDGAFAGDEYFLARQPQQKAELVKNTEEYYSAMVRCRPHMWNLRDRHISETLKKLVGHLETRLGREPRIVVWAHNIMRKPWQPHLGNAAATHEGRRGDINIGQLVRENYGDKALRIGFSTSRGTVTAASHWDGPTETKTIREPLSGSYADIFSRLVKQRFLLDFRGQNSVADLLKVERLQRAIGVIYRPETEDRSHYFYTSLPRQLDFLIHITETEAVSPLNGLRG
jgi:erythromycin esterase-like protein